MLAALLIVMMTVKLELLIVMNLVKTCCNSPMTIVSAIAWIDLSNLVRRSKSLELRDQFI